VVERNVDRKNSVLSQSSTSLESSLPHELIEFRFRSADKQPQPPPPPQEWLAAPAPTPAPQAPHVVSKPEAQPAAPEAPPKGHGVVPSWNKPAQTGHWTTPSVWSLGGGGVTTPAVLPAGGGDCPPGSAEQLLQMHNKVRGYHGAPPMSLSPEVSVL